MFAQGNVGRRMLAAFRTEYIKSAIHDVLHAAY